MRLAALAALALAAWAGEAPRLFYSKTFPGSKPAYAEIRLDRQGRAEYREAPDEEDPLVCQLTKAEADTLFELAERLNHFQTPLESGLPVARMGEKLLRWEQGAERHEARFNYTQNADAQLLYDWFERITESEEIYIELERTAKYDRLGVHQALLKLEAGWDRRRLVGVTQYLKLLDRVAANESYLNMARERAAKLAMLFRDPSPAPKPESKTP